MDLCYLFGVTSKFVSRNLILISKAVLTMLSEFLNYPFSNVLRESEYLNHDGPIS